MKDKLFKSQYEKLKYIVVQGHHFPTHFHSVEYIPDQNLGPIMVHKLGNIVLK